MDNDEVDLWATDEVHFQQHGSRCRMWVPPETKDPVLLHHPTRRSVGYFGAVRLRDGKFRFSRETGKFNAMTFFAFLKMLRRTSIRSGRSVVVVSACTTDAFLRWRKSSLPWKHSLDIGLTETRPCVGYAQLLKTLRIASRTSEDTETALPAERTTQSPNKPFPSNCEPDKYIVSR